MVKIVFSKAAIGGVLKVQKIRRKTQGQNLFFSKLAGAADVFTYHLNLKIFEQKVNDIFQGFTE